jgi:hypothetical protein
MNIFVLDTDVKKCAAYHCDRHLIKMITEHNQILGSIAHTSRGISKKSEITPEYIIENFKGFPRVNENRDISPYGIGYKTHPCTQWAKASSQNYEWVCSLTEEMCKEYTRRYKKIHAGEAVINWYRYHQPQLPSHGMTPFAQAMPEYLKSENAVHSYRLYYVKHKSNFATWKNGEPEWWNKYMLLEV